MNAWPDAPELRAFLARGSRRLAWIAAAEGAAAGLASALVLPLISALTEWRPATSSAVLAGLSLALVGALLRCYFALRAKAAVARRVERQAPECRNLIITAAELIDAPARVNPYIGALVLRDAARLVQRLDTAALFPARRAFGAAGIAGGLFVLASALVAARPPAPPSLLKAASGEAVINDVEVIVTPPSYAGRPARSWRDPARIEALSGSTVRLRVRASAGAIAVETVQGRQQLISRGQGQFDGELRADADGYIAIEPLAAQGPAGPRRLIGLSVSTDQPPAVRVSAPARDLFLPDTQRVVNVAIEAHDDLALASLRLRYTRVSGSGERFSFTDGELPIQVTRAAEKRWTARGVLQLSALGLATGDMLVYRAVATDRRPGAAASESDSYIVEITSPGSVAAEGFAIDDDEDKYGISQQMVILKTERLIARARTLSADSLNLQARTIAAEQRAVRAEFVFMMGGELAEEILAEASMDDLNEEAHAEADDEAIAGRLANRGRLDLLRAIRSMSRANTALNATDLSRALGEEKAALGALERAFSRTRYILRALTQRERLDLSRRLTGGLSTAASDTRANNEANSNPRVAALRRLLAGIAELAGSRVLDSSVAARASILAEEVLRVDPSAPALQDVATSLSATALALQLGRTSEARGLIEKSATQLVSAVRTSLLNAPPRAPSLEMGKLDGALTDALRRAGGVR